MARTARTTRPKGTSRKTTTRAKANASLGAYGVISYVEMPDCSLRVLRLGGDKEVNLHYHSKCSQVYFILKGTAEVTVNGKVTKLKEHQTARVPVRAAHGIRSDDGAIALSISIPPLDLADQVPVQEGYTKP
ncbi:MAG: cupin domain-containing protein [Chloroflexota bacterium]